MIRSGDGTDSFGVIVGLAGGHGAWLQLAGAGRRQQLGHAARLLVRAVPLRVAMLAPRREKASP